MPDNIVLNNVPRPQQSWFAGANQLHAPISQAMTALEKGASNYTLASVSAAMEPTLVTASVESVTAESVAAEPVRENISGLEQALDQVKLDQRAAQSNALVEDYDAELTVAALLEEISSVMEDIGEKRLAPNEQVVDLVTALFHDIERHIDDVPQHLAIEVGETGADLCWVIEAQGASAQPIIAFFNP